MIVAVVGISFAAFTYTKAGTTTNTISTGTVTMAYEEGENGINIQNAIPMDDETGKALKGDNNVFDFTVSATIVGKTTIDYAIFAVKDQDNSTILDENIRLYLESSDTKEGDNYTQSFGPAAFSTTSSDPEFSVPSNSMKLTQGSFVNSNSNGEKSVQNKYYRLRMWVDKDYQLTDTAKTYKVTVNVYGKGQD